MRRAGPRDRSTACVPEIALGADALGEMLERNAGALARRLDRLGAKVVLSEHAVAALDADRRRAVPALVRGLAERGRVIVAPPVRDLFARERASSRDRPGTPTRSRAALRAWLDSLASDPAESDELPRWTASLRSVRVEDVAGDRVAHLVASFSPNAHGMDVVPDLTPRDVFVRRRIAADAWRHPTHASWVGMSQLAALAGAFEGHAVRRALFVASIARATFVVTEDEPIRAALAELRRAALAQVLPAPLRDLETLLEGSAT